MSKFRSWYAIALASLLLSCGKKDLDRATAMKLLQGRAVETIRCSFSSMVSGVSVAGGNAIDQAYKHLMNAGVLHCKVSPYIFSQETLECRENSLVAGNLVATAVTGVTKASDNTAVAEVRLSFQPTPFYARHSSEFDQLELTNTLMQPTEHVRNRAQRTVAQATFQLFDDGWRLQSIQ